MHVELYLEHIKRGVIPDSAPDGLVRGGFTSFDNAIGMDNFLKYFQVREECTKNGIWAIVDDIWTRELASWIGDRKCIEVMAGAGWLSRALANHGVDIKASDNDSWIGKQHNSNLNKVFDVYKWDAIETIHLTSDYDVLLVSWPPLDSRVICDVCDAWGSGPIVYIGEGPGGCCAPDEFWANFNEYPDYPDFNMKSWHGIHDYVYIGEWGKQVEKIEVEKIEEIVKKEADINPILDLGM